jgi:hypothetical protein
LKIKKATRLSRFFVGLQLFIKQIPNKKNPLENSRGFFYLILLSLLFDCQFADFVTIFDEIESAAQMTYVYLHIVASGIYFHHYLTGDIGNS